MFDLLHAIIAVLYVIVLGIVGFGLFLVVVYFIFKVATYAILDARFRFETYLKGESSNPSEKEN